MIFVITYIHKLMLFGKNQINEKQKKAFLNHPRSMHRKTVIPKEHINGYFPYPHNTSPPYPKPARVPTRANTRRVERASNARIEHQSVNRCSIHTVYSHCVLQLCVLETSGVGKAPPGFPKLNRRTTGYCIFISKFCITQFLRFVA